MNNFEKGPVVSEKPEDKFWKMPLEEQIIILKQIFTEEDLVRFNFFEVQETAPLGNYEETVNRESSNGRIGSEAINYIKRYDLLKDKQEEIRKILENK